MVHADMKKEKVGIPTGRIEKTGVFDLDGIYTAIVKWLKKMEYTVIEKDTSAKKDTPLREFKIVFSGKRHLTSYLRYNIEVNIWATGVVDVKVKGKKLKKGHIEVTFIANYQKNWQKTFKIEWMRRVYEQIIWTKLMKYEGKLFVEVISLKNAVKKVMKKQLISNV